MIARIMMTLIMLVTVTSINLPSAHAAVEPIVAADSFFTAINAGDDQAAVEAFTADAVASLSRGETYSGQADLASLVQVMNHPGRRYQIVDSQAQGDILTMHVAVSDHGIRWGQATIEIQAQDGKLRAFRETAFQLQLGS